MSGNLTNRNMTAVSVSILEIETADMKKRKVLLFSSTGTTIKLTVKEIVIHFKILLPMIKHP